MEVKGGKRESCDETDYNKLAAVLCSSLIIGANSANAQTAQAIAKKAFGSTVLLVMEDANGRRFLLAAAFSSVPERWLHVVEGAVRGYAKLISQKTKHDLEGITAVDPRRDVVLKIAAAGSPTPW